MKWRLTLKPQAGRDINNQFEYITKDLEALFVFTNRLSRARDVLLTNPNIGPRIASKKDELIPHFFRGSYIGQAE